VRIGVDGRYLSDAYPGIGRTLFHLVRGLAALAASGDEIVVLHDPEAPRTRLLPAALAGPRVSLVPARIAPRSLAEQALLTDLVRGLRLDVFHAPYPFTALSCPVPRVVTVYDLIAPDRRHGLASPLKRALAGLALGRVARSAAALVTPSRATRDAVAARFPDLAERVVVTGAALDPDLAPASRVAIDETRRVLRLPARYALYLGTHRAHKNLGRLLGAWAATMRTRGDTAAPVGLVLAGPAGRDVDDLRGRARAVGLAGVTFPGAVAEEHLAPLVTGADVLVLPSLDEGYGLTAAEAMACGTPVACARRGALSEVAGTAALYFDPEDTADMARAIGRLLDDEGERRERAREGLERARRARGDTAARRTWAVYRAVARGGAIDPTLSAPPEAPEEPAA
jgi:glycosyltransferase involved in cell wall biosynthesis